MPKHSCAIIMFVLTSVFYAFIDLTVFYERLQAFLSLPRFFADIQFYQITFDYFVPYFHT